MAANANANYTNPLPFWFFCELLAAIQDIKPVPTGERRSSGKSQESKTFKRWIDKLRESPLPAGTGVIFFRLFFPEEGVRRRYGLKEQTLCGKLAKYFKERSSTFDGWCSATLEQRSLSLGCLGAEVVRLLPEDYLPRRQGTLTLGRVDQLLDELASFSDFSAAEVTALRPRGRAKVLRTVDDVLKDLFDQLTAPQLGFMIQIILRDLSPLLYTHPSQSGSIALLTYTSAAYHKIELREAMELWDQRMPGLSRVTSDLDVVARTLEQPSDGAGGIPPRPTPIIGIPVQYPKSARPGTCSKATKDLRGLVAVETKYDGERLQIHIDMTLPYDEQITIRSKSGRNSTDTRHLLLPIIRASLGLHLLPSSISDFRLSSRTKSHHHYAPNLKRLILEGEMIPYNEDESRIDEFWKLAAVKCGTMPSVQAEESQDSVETGGTSSPAAFSLGRWWKQAEKPLPPLHLAIAWFDLLLVNEENLLDSTYAERRARLETLVRPIDGFSMLAEHKIINFDHKPTALHDLHLRFADIITDRGEGLMLKPLFSKYNDWGNQRWVKLKKDFIPGAGDTMDFEVVGVSWQLKRARELLVPTSIFTTFFIGMRADNLGTSCGPDRKPHYHILFTTSYGLSRERLETLCHNIRQSKPEPFKAPNSNDRNLKTTFEAFQRGTSHWPVYSSPCTTFTFSLADHLKGKAECPWYILKEPRIFELTGAGFQKSHGSPFYELRWARITKTCRPDPEVLTLEQLQKTATEAMQVVNDDVERRMDEIWPRKKGSARRETREEKRVREVREWVRRLERADGVAEKDGRTLGSVTNLGKGREEGRREGLAKEEPPTKRRKREVRREDAMVIWIDDPDSPVASTLTPLPGRAPVGTSTTDSSLTRRPRPHSHIAKLPHSSNSLPSSLVDIPSPSIAPSPPNHPSELPLSLQLPTPPPSSGALPLKLQTISRPPLPRTSLSLSVASLSAPPSNFFWSIYPPPTSSAPLDPRHPELDTGNYLLDPRNVLWAAGWELEGREAYRGVRRSGYVFVEEGEAEKVTKWASKRGGEETVWLIERERLDKVGLEDSVLEVL